MSAGPHRGRWRWLLNPLRILLHFWQFGYLIRQLAWRQALARYRGSWLGVLWSLIEPLLMFFLYFFVFSLVFEVRWGELQESRAAYALNLFAGLTLYNLFAETLNGATGLVVEHRSFVRKAIFPLEALPVARLLANSLHSSLALAILLAAVLGVTGRIPWTVVLLPVVLFPLAMLTLGLSFFVAALAVFVRDVGNVVRLAVLAALFLSPVFYPASRLPPSWQPLLFLNPLTALIQALRAITIEGVLPDVFVWVVMTGLSLVVAWGGVAWFMRSKNAFADVL